MRLALLAALSVAVCQRPAPRGNPSASPDGSANSPGAKSRDEKPKADKGEPETPNCSSGGTVWNGKPSGCLYEVAGCCYDNPAQACAAADCTPDNCQILESAPAQAECMPA